MKVDVFTFYNEIELLDFRLNHLKGLVDHVVIVEGDRTYAGKQYTSQLIGRNLAEEYGYDITHIIVPLKEFPSSRWENEALQRKIAGQFARDTYPEATIFFSCVDEILDPAVYTEYDTPHTLSLQNFYYYFNGKDVGEKPDHPMPIAFPASALKDTDLHSLWESRHGFPTLFPAGWHFSYLGGVDRIKEKLEAYSHVENDTPAIKDSLEDNIAAGRDIFSRPDHKFEYVKIDDSFPQYLVDNQDKYKELIHEA